MDIERITSSKLQASQDRQKRFHERVHQSRRFTVAQQRALTVSSKKAFDTYWNEMQAAQGSFKDAREVGSGRFFKRVTSLAASSHEMIEGFNPIISFVKDSGAPFGGLAIGTVCFLFAVWIICMPNENAAVRSSDD